MSEKVKISKIPSDKRFEEYSEDAIFVLDDEDEEGWDDEEGE